MNDKALRGYSLSEAGILFNKEKNYMKVLRKLVSLRLSPELIKMGKIEAEEQGRSFSNYIEYILVQHFKNQKGKNND